MKIYLVREHIDWHNCDADDLTRAFQKKEEAYKCLEKRIALFKRTMNKWDREIEGEYGNALEGIGISTSSDDYYNAWVESINLK